MCSCWNCSRDSALSKDLLARTGTNKDGSSDRRVQEGVEEHAVDTVDAVDAVDAVDVDESISSKAEYVLVLAGSVMIKTWSSVLGDVENDILLLMNRLWNEMDDLKGDVKRAMNIVYCQDELLTVMMR